MFFEIDFSQRLFFYFTSGCEEISQRKCTESRKGKKEEGERERERVKEKLREKEREPRCLTIVCEESWRHLTSDSKQCLLNTARMNESETKQNHSRRERERESEKS